MALGHHWPIRNTHGGPGVAHRVGRHGGAHRIKTRKRLSRVRMKIGGGWSFILGLLFGAIAVSLISLIFINNHY